MKSVAALLLLTLIAIQLAPPSGADPVQQTATVHALGGGKAYDITFALQSRSMTIRGCDLVSRVGSVTIQPFTTVKSSSISAANPLGGSTIVGLHIETNATALSFAGDFALVNGQLTAIDGSGTEHQGGDTSITAIPLMPVAIVPALPPMPISGLPTLPVSVC